MPSTKANKRKVKKATTQRHGGKAIQHAIRPNSIIARQKKLLKLEEQAGYRGYLGPRTEFANVDVEPSKKKIEAALKALLGNTASKRWIKAVENGDNPFKYVNKIHAMFLNFFVDKYEQFAPDEYSDEDESYMDTQVPGDLTRQNVLVNKDEDEDDSTWSFDSSDYYEEEEEEDDVEYFDYNKNEDGTDDDEGELLFQ